MSFIPAAITGSLETILPTVVRAFSCDTLRGSATVATLDSRGMIQRGDFFAKPGEFGALFNHLGPRLDAAHQPQAGKPHPIAPISVNINGNTTHLTQVAIGNMQAEPLIGLPSAAVHFLDEMEHTVLGFWLYFNPHNLQQPLGHGVEFNDIKRLTSVRLSSVVPRLARFSGWQLVGKVRGGPADLDSRFRQFLVTRGLVTADGKKWNSASWSQDPPSTQGNAFVVESSAQAELNATIQFENEEGTWQPNVGIFYGVRGFFGNSRVFSPQQLMANPEIFERYFLTQWGEIEP